MLIHLILKKKMPLNRFFFFFFLVPFCNTGVEPRALYKLGKHFVPELWFSPNPTLHLSFKDTEIERK